MHPIISRRLAQLLAVAVSALVLAGCGTGEGQERVLGTPQQKLVGLLIDAPVEGVEYETTFGDSGITDASGQFSYLPNELVTFRIGDIELGTAPGAPIVTPVELTNSVDPTSRSALNLAIFLQSLDADATPANGIQISGAVRSAAAGMSLNFNAVDFDALVADAVATLTGGGNAVVDAATALENFYEAYVEFGGTDSVTWQFPGFPAVGNGVTYELVFADEFSEGSVPSPEKWNIETGYGDGGWGNNEWQNYTDSADNLRVEDGNLVIQARCDEPCGVRDGSVTSARINTLNNFDFRYGRIVARIKAPVGEGSWPAFWSLGSNFPEVGWPRSGEIDYMELFPSVSDERTTHFAMHWCDETIQFPQTCSFPEGRRFVSDELTIGEPLGDEFHIYEAVWSENLVIGKIDGVEFFRFAINPATMEEFRREFFMILNVAMGGTLGSDNRPPSGNETWPQTMLVDYVRVYQQTGGGGPTQDTLIDFEDAPESYDFGESGGFAGGASAVIANPVPGGINTSAQVVRMLKFSGDVFGGSLLTLPTPAEITEAGNATLKVWSPRSVGVTVKFEGDLQEERTVFHGGTGWEELTFDFSGVTGVVPGVSFIFDLGIVGDATNDPDNWTFYYDDLVLPTAATDIVPAGGLVSDFELNAQSYDFGLDGGFGGGAAAVIENPVSEGINTSDQVVRMLKFNAEPFGGALWTLPSPLTVPNGSSFTMKVWSLRRVPVLFKLEGGTPAEASVTHGGNGWELLTFDFPGIESVYSGITVIFDNGVNGDAQNDPFNWTFYYDDITLIVDPDPDPLPVFPEQPFDFERPASNYDFGLDGGFGGGAAEVVANPVSGGINTSAQVGRMIKFAGDDFGGTTLFLDETLELPANSAFRMKVWSQRSVDVTFKLETDPESNPPVEVVLTHQGSGWEQMFFDFGSFAGNVTGITLIFDNGTVGDAENNPADWTFYFDDIELTTSDDAPPPPLLQIDLPITFDDPTVDYTVIDFGDPVTAVTTLVADPDDSTNTVASTLKPAGTPVWAGTTMSTEAGLATAIPFSATTATIGVRVYSPAAGLPVHLKADNVVGGNVSVEASALTTMANQWETLVFDFDNPVETSPALDLGTDYTALSIFFNFGTDGDTAGPLTFLWDDVEFGTPLPVPDTTPPVLTTVSVSSSNANPALATTGDIVTVTLVADEPIAAPVVSIGGAAADAVTGAGTSWQATRALDSGDADGVVSIAVTATDLSGNEAAVVTATTDSSSVTLDATAPTVSIVNAPTSFSTLAPFPVTFEFTETVSGFTLADIVVTGGAKSGFAAVDGATYTANMTPNGNGDLVISVAAAAASDAAGNASEAAAPVTVFNGLDADAPLLNVISIASDNANPAFARAGDVVTISMTANEDILAPTVTIAGAEADSVDGMDTMWVASRTLLATDPEGPIAFTINFEDVGGNAGPESTITTDDSSVTLDRTAPSLTIGGLPGAINVVQPIALTFDFDEDVIGFDVGDIMVTNGSVDAFVPVDDASYTANVLPDGTGDLTVTVAAAAATDAAGNGNAEVFVTATVDLQPIWSEVWSDDFEDGVIDTGLWDVRDDGNCPAPCDIIGQQSYDLAQVTEVGGVLRIDAVDVGGYISGLVVGNRALKYGRVEIVARMPAAAGAAPSLWMLPVGNAYGEWPASGEIDIVNAPNLGVANQTLEHTLRYGLPLPEDTSTTVAMDAPVGMPADMNFLDYAIEWEAGEIRWFVNDVHVATQTQANWYAYSEDPENGGVYTLGTGAAPFDEEFSLLLSLAVGDSADGSSFALEIDSVRAFECANAIDPDAGTGCSTGTGVPAVMADSEPFTASLEVYTDAPAELGFIDPNDPGTPVNGTLVPGSSTAGPGVMVTSNIAAMDGADTVWNVVIAADLGRGGVTMAAQENGAASGFFDLSGGETAGELKFRMRVTSATSDPVLEVGLNGANGAKGRDEVTFTADNTWRQYSVKIANVVTNSVDGGTTLDMSNITDLFVLEASGGSITFDLDDIEVVVACLDETRCEATPRLPDVTVYYEQDFELLIPAENMVPNSLSNDGWLVGGNVYTPAGVYISGYFAFPSPNGGPAFSAVDTGQGGPEQGLNQLSVYNNYNDPNHGNGTGNLIEANVFQEATLTEDDIGRTYTFAFDSKRGNIAPPSTAMAFIKTLDPGDGFAVTLIDEVDLTAVPADWGRYELMITIPGDMAFVGQRFQFGFLNVASNFGPSGVFYDNIQVTSTAAP